jgi:hypothetical protein
MTLDPYSEGESNDGESRNDGELELIIRVSYSVLS